MIKETNCRALAVSDDEMISVMVNEEDHFRIQCILPGLQLNRPGRRLPLMIFWNRKLILLFMRILILTACPTNVGTGLRVSRCICRRW